jgi:uncharacterized repeat protein (TIGR03843 family)
VDDGWFDEDDSHDPEGPEDADLEPYTYDATVAPGSPTMPDLLRSGTIEVLGRMPWSSNATFLVSVDHGTDHAPAIYKPERGERPLWDFPCGLWRREVAAYELSEALGFSLVPPTVERSDAPVGIGSLQAFVPARFEEHYFTMRERDSLGATFRQLCAFDLIANSADRKGGHCLIDRDDRVWAIDNGLAFHEDLKLRTVVWDYAGEPLPDGIAAAVGALVDGGLPGRISDLLTGAESVALTDRARALLSRGRFPHDPTGRRYPWPLV